MCGIIIFMPDEEKINKIKKLKSRLYEKGFKEKPQNISEFERKQYRVKGGWIDDNPPMSPRKAIKITKRNMNIKKILIVAILFFVISVGVAFFIIRNGSNVFSLKNVDINISAPVSVNGGEKFTINLSVTNNNDTALEFADLSIKYPEGAYASFDSQTELIRDRESLGRIAPNETVKKSISLILFGSGGSKKEIKFTMEGRFAGSSATLDKIKVYDVSLSSSPINLSVNIPKKIGTKQEFEIDVNLESNSNNTLKNLLLKIDYPRGFAYASASPNPSSNNNIWNIGDMSSSNKRVVKIIGTIEGKADEQKIFTISVGSKDTKNKNIIGTVYNSASPQVGITKPFLGLRVLMNGAQTPEYITKERMALRFDVLWSSNSPMRILNGAISAKLDGGIVDGFSVSADKGGFYKSLGSTISWGGRSGDSELSVIEPGASGRVSFTLQSLPLVDKNGRVFKDPEINVTVKATGNKATERGLPSNLSVSVSKKIKIESNLNIIPRAVYYSGPFKNTGPLPPVVDRQTTYTIILSVTNTSSDIASTVVKTTLPTYVKWLGVVSPSSENVTFNKNDGQVVWNIGDVPAGVGFVAGAREVAFQVGLIPSVSQSGRTPFLIGEVDISGKDTFTGTILKNTKKGVNINLSSDPSFSVSQAFIKTN